MALALELQHVSFHYTGLSALSKDVLKDISLTIQDNECVAIVGPSGSGKTTLVQHFTGLLKPVSGKVFFNGDNIWQKKFSQAKLRKKIGIVFQFPETQLFEETVFRDIAFGPRHLGIPEEKISEHVHRALKSVQLAPDVFANRSPFELSEGEKRRVAIAGVLAMNPELVVFDEPTAGLDPRGVKDFTRLVRQLLYDNKGIVVITHNMDFVAEVAPRSVVLFQGEKIFDGGTRSLFRDEDLLERADLELPSLLQALKEQGDSVPPDFFQAMTLSEIKQIYQQRVKKQI